MAGRQKGFAAGLVAALVVGALAIGAWALFFRGPDIAGTWTGQRTGGSVSEIVSYVFSPDGSYTLSTSSENRGVVTGSSVSGTWSLRGGKLLLDPQTVSFESAGQTAEVPAGQLGQEQESFDAQVSEDGTVLTISGGQDGAATQLSRVPE